MRMVVLGWAAVASTLGFADPAGTVEDLVSHIAPGAEGTSVFVARVEHAAAQAARARVLPPDRFEVLSSRFTGADSIPTGPMELGVLDAEGPNEWGVCKVRMRVIAGGEPSGEAWASVRGSVRGPVLVATKPLPRGLPIPAGSVETAERDLTRLGEEPLRDPAGLVGRVPTRVIAAGRALTPSLLARAVVVRRGQAVELRVRRGPLIVTARGTARRDGAPGETILAENLSTGATVVGRVEADGSISVVGPAATGRKR